VRRFLKMIQVMPWDEEAADYYAEENIMGERFFQI
jgi:hypothetical protein